MKFVGLCTVSKDYWINSCKISKNEKKVISIRKNRDCSVEKSVFRRMNREADFGVKWIWISTFLKKIIEMTQ